MYRDNEELIAAHRRLRKLFLPESPVWQPLSSLSPEMRAKIESGEVEIPVVTFSEKSLKRRRTKAPHLP